MLYIGGFMDNTSHLIYGILTHFISGINTVVICTHIISYHLIELRVNNLLNILRDQQDGPVGTGV